MSDLQSVEQLQAFVDQHLPGITLIIEDVSEGRSRVRFPIENRYLRPGGTVAGPLLFTVADCALYIAILVSNPSAVMAVTSNLNISFFSKPVAEKDIIGKCRLIKSGSRLVFGEVFLYSDGDENPVAHAIGTYAVPSKTETT